MRPSLQAYSLLKKKLEISEIPKEGNKLIDGLLTLNVEHYVIKI